MKKYRVMVEGGNFLLNMNDEAKKYGFYTTRFVEAQSQEEAENVVINILRDEPKLTGIVLNEREDPPMMYIVEIEELDHFDDQHTLATGFAFFPEKGKS